MGGLSFGLYLFLFGFFFGLLFAFCFFFFGFLFLLLLFAVFSLVGVLNVQLFEQGLQLFFFLLFLGLLDFLGFILLCSWSLFRFWLLWNLLGWVLLLFLLVAGRIVNLEWVSNSVQSELFLFEFFSLEAPLDGFDIGELSSEFFPCVEGHNVGFFLFGLLWLCGL